MSDDTPDDTKRITVERVEKNIYAAHGPCPECPREGYGTSKSQARESMRHICRECRENI